VYNLAVSDFDVIWRHEDREEFRITQRELRRHSKAKPFTYPEGYWRRNNLKKVVAKLAHPANTGYGILQPMITPFNLRDSFFGRIGWLV